MTTIKHRSFLVFFIFALIFPFFVSAQTTQSVHKDEIFKAQVIETLKQEKKELDNGQETVQQNLMLRGMEEKWKDKEFKFEGIGDFSVVKNKEYSIGDKVWVAVNYNDKGDSTFHVVDYVRTKALLWLAGVFVFVVLAVGGIKGLRAMLSLVATFAIIIGYIVPSILNGVDPLIPTLVGATGMLLIIIYLTEGFRLKSHIAVVSTFASLVFIIFFSWLFVDLVSLTGITSQNSTLIINMGKHVVNFRGLLLAGVIIGTLGVLNDVVVSQVSTVEQIFHTNRFLGGKEIFKGAYKVGVSHISSMTNTLFLAYAGVSLPLLLLFISGNSAFTGWIQIINNEAIATEIVRTLAGSIGIVLSMPLSTAIASWWFKIKGSKA